MDKLEHNALPHSAWSSVEILTNEHKFLEIAYYFAVIQDQQLFFPITIEIRDRKKIMCCCEAQRARMLAYFLQDHRHVPNTETK